MLRPFLTREGFELEIINLSDHEVRYCTGCVYHDGPADKASVVIKTPAETWLKISRGELNGQQAFMSGQYKVEGDLSLLQKLRALFPG